MRFCKIKMSSRVRGGGSVLLASLLLAGCGLLDSKKTDYRAVQPGKPLDIPPELSAPAKDDRYTVSEASSKGTTFSSYNAERAAQKATMAAAAVEPETKIAPVVASNDKLRIERAGNQRWLVMPGTTAQVWPQIKRFVEARGLVVKSESAELGLLETEWAEKAIYVPEAGIRGQLARALGSLYSTSERDKYRIRIEPGKEAGTTEVFVSHRGVEEVFVTADHAETRWQPRPNDPELEAELIGRLIRFVGVDEAKAGTIVAAGKAATGDRARLVDGGNSVQVVVDERFDRAWRRVGLALDRNGFTVEDRDRANGLYYVRYIDPLADKPAASKGWLASLAFWNNDNAAAEPVQTVFRVAVVGVGEESARVEVQDKSGVALATASARRILEIVRKELN